MWPHYHWQSLRLWPLELFQDFKKHVAFAGAAEERFSPVAGTRDKVQVLGTAKSVRDEVWLER
jgi:hypothetical protein